ncbi:hypothetical protein CPZ29_05565 [Klebsiella oxytoca]|nr:hypothetical protein CPZ29_05565 [Klebsiella oxytoca]PHH13253.1 hypothetical protein CRX54_06770 [Klebsiella oxytoca]
MTISNLNVLMINNKNLSNVSWRDADISHFCLNDQNRYATTVIFLALYCQNSDADNWLGVSLVWKTIAIALNVQRQQIPALVKSLWFWSYIIPIRLLLLRGNGIFYIYVASI